MRKIKTLLVRNWDHDPSVVTSALESGMEFIVNNEAIPTRKFDGTCCMIKDGKLYKRHDRKKYRKGKRKGEWKPEPGGWIPVQVDGKTGHWWGWAIVDFDDPNDWRHAEAWKFQASRVVPDLVAIPVLASTISHFNGKNIAGGNHAMVDIHAGYEQIDLETINISKIDFKESIESRTRVIQEGGSPGKTDSIARNSDFDLVVVKDGDTLELCGPKVNGNPERLEKHVLIPHGKCILDFSFQGGDPYDELKAWFEGKDIEGIVWWKDGEPVAKIKKSDFGMKRKPSET